MTPLTVCTLYSLASVTPPAEMAKVASFSGMSGLKGQKQRFKWTKKRSCRLLKWKITREETAITREKRNFLGKSHHLVWQFVWLMLTSCDHRTTRLTVQMTACSYFWTTYVKGKLVICLSQWKCQIPSRKKENKKQRLPVKYFGNPHLSTSLPQTDSCGGGVGQDVPTNRLLRISLKTMIKSEQEKTASLKTF